YMVKQYRIRRDYVMERIKGIPGLSCHTPGGTFYAFIDIQALGMSSEEFAIKLLEAEQVVIVPGSAFGEFGEGYIRLSYAASMEDLRQGLDKIEAFVRSLR
ncbi:MAG TPA: aminotransferase class I/II-fold pyridoxal phosphate-dependent enzyme, partial [Candidatus Enterenecus stercoripullorum]|nr:aminotransferase class I/II-fold pyridoxal phosphate-dependent enzyme [Candidatus Enterenecus stercoripullorum]